MYKVIMVAVDGSKCSTLALDEAVRMARACDADLEIIRVVDNSYLKYDVGSFDVGDLRKSLIESGQKLLAEAQATAHAQGSAQQDAPGRQSPGFKRCLYCSRTSRARMRCRAHRGRNARTPRHAARPAW